MRTALQIEDIFQPIYDAFPLHYFFDAEQHAGDKGGAVKTVMTDGQGLTETAENNFLVCHKTRQTHTMYMNAVEAAAAGTGYLFHFFHRPG